MLDAFKALDNIDDELVAPVKKAVNKDKRINELTGQIDDITVQEQEKDKRINELTRQVDIITKQKQEKDEKIGILLEQKEELEKFKKDVYNSTSWKITKPLRKLKFWK